jgi:hypothetical protein
MERKMENGGSINPMIGNKSTIINSENKK